MKTKTEISKETASLLLEINAIKLQPEQYFTWASGWFSPIYCDNRIMLSYPKVRNYVKVQMAEKILSLYGKPDVIAGVATGAIGIGMLVADVLDVPFVYVRPEPKKHGRQNQIEGYIEPNQKVVIVEDLISTGKSSLMAVDALRNAQVDILGMIAVFTYGFDVAKNNFEQANISLQTLSNYNDLIEEAIEKNYVKQNDLETLNAWRQNPSVWKK